MKKRSLKIMSVVLAGVMTTGMILGGCSAGGDKENGGNKEASKELNLWMHNGCLLYTSIASNTRRLH